ENGQLVENDRSVLDEAAIGVGRIAGKAQHPEAEALEQPAVRGVLGYRAREVDGLAREERQLAAREGRRDVAGERDLVHARICRAARWPLAIAPATVPISSGSVASPAKKSVPWHGRPSARWAGRPPTPT